MAGFQAGVERYREIGIPGQVATDNEVVYLPYTPAAEDGSGGENVTVGFFVWEGTNADNDKQVQPIGAGSPIGFVTRVQRYFNLDITSEASQVVPAPYPVEVAQRGDFFAIASTAATVGQKVFASNLTVDIKTGAAGATISNYTETSFTVKSAGDAGDVIEISNWDAVEPFTPTLSETITDTTSVISLTTQITYFDTTAGASTATLADGALDQTKELTMTVDGGDQVVTPANLLGGTTITFADAADSVTLRFNGTSWYVISNNGATVA